MKAIRTIYTCERCGKEATVQVDKEAEQYWFVGLSINWVNSSSTNVSDRQLWCRKCCDELQLIKDPPKDKTGLYIEPIMTLEDKIIGILNDLGFTQAE